MAALGLIEVIGMVSAVTTLDTMLKAAQVKRLSVEKVKGGLVAVMVTGDVGAVRAAVAAGLVTARELGTVISHHVIPRPAVMTEIMLEQHCGEQSSTEPEQADLEPGAAEKSAIDEQDVIEDVKESSEPENDTEVQTNNIAEVDAGIAVPSVEQMQKMKVVDLRKLARELELTSMSRQEIKFARKDELIREISKLFEKR